MALRPLAWLLAAGAAGWGALALTEEPPAPAAAVPADAPPRTPSPVLQMMGLAAPTTTTTATSAPAADTDTGAEARLLDDLVRHREAALPALEAFARTWPARALALYDGLLTRWAALRLHAQAMQALDRAPLAEDMRERLRQQLLERWAETAPDQAARWALNTAGQAARLAPLQDRWLQQDARSATVFATQLPPGALRQALLDEGLSRWTAQDGASARDWLRSMAPLPELDAAIAQHAASDELAREAPAEAMALVARIASPEKRWQAWQTLAAHLHDIDPTQTAHWLAQAPGLTVLEQQRLLDGQRSGPGAVD
ncbi:hypothetical protein LXT12_17715 [Pelomonas sp. P7]|uniref:Secreted protein n=1 Tax=Pelomonas caseinilytica TaxID=2906763 RepID=A0ABS8XKI8_9BURK|nr:hypothetical protein [Pelomonas sp. P7]MCE4539091.1 hypothetical protein [Pelomonas sp. P7]